MAWAVIALGVIGVKSVSAQCMYEIVAEISAPGCPPFGNAPIVGGAINDNGVVVGHYVDCAFNDNPFMWSEETGFVQIPLPPGVLEAEPRDINSNGEIVGSLVRPDLGETHAFHWKEGVWTELPSLPGYPIARAKAINDEGLIVGEAFDPNAIAKPFRAVQWHNGVISLVDLPLGPNSYAEDVNRDASIVGLMGDAITTTSLGFLQSKGMTTEIPPVSGGHSCEARAVNNHNMVTGRTRFIVKSGPAPDHSWVLENGKLTDLGLLPEADHRTIAFDIHDASQIVGSSIGIENGTDKPFLWQHGEIRDLRELIVDLPTGAFLSRALTINHRGEIVVEDTGSTIRLLVLAPLDRPLGDVNIDCVVDERDLITVLGDWGPDKEGHLADMVTNETFQPPGDGVVDGADLAVVLGNWTVFSSQSSPQRSQ